MIIVFQYLIYCYISQVRCKGVVEILEWHETTEAFLLVMVRPHPAVDLYDYVSKQKRLKESLARYL